MNLNHELSSAQTLAMTACMLAISKVDGVHPAETALIRAFYESGRERVLPSFEAVQASDVSALANLAALTPDDEFNQTLATMCLMTGYADGNLSDGERAEALAFAQAVGMTTDQFDAVLQQVRDSLLGSLAHLPDAESVATLAKEL